MTGTTDRTLESFRDSATFFPRVDLCRFVFCIGRFPLCGSLELSGAKPSIGMSLAIPRCGSALSHAAGGALNARARAESWGARSLERAAQCHPLTSNSRPLDLLYGEPFNSRAPLHRPDRSKVATRLVIGDSPARGQRIRSPAADALTRGPVSFSCSRSRVSVPSLFRNSHSDAAEELFKRVARNPYGSPDSNARHVAVSDRGVHRPA